MYRITVATILLWVGSVQAFTAITGSGALSLSCTQLHAVPPPYNPYGGMASATSILKPGRSYAPTQPGVKHTGSREEGYLGNLQRASRGDGYQPSTPSYAADGIAPVSIAATQTESLYQPAVPPPAPETTVPTGRPQIFTAVLTADGVDGRSSSKILFNARSDQLAPPPVSPPPTRVTNERGNIKSGSIPMNARVFLKGDGESKLNEQGAEITMNPANVERVPVVASTAPMHVRNAMAGGYDSQLVPAGRRSSFALTARRSNFAPTQSDIKFKSASTGSSYLEGLSRQSQVSYRSPMATRMTDPFAPSKMAAQAVSGLLHVDPRSGESFSSDPFAISRKAADAVSLLLLKYTEPKDAVFYLT